MSLRRHVLQVVALVTAVALVFGAFAGSASAKKMTKGQKAKVRAELRKQVKKNPGAVKRKSFLRRAALVNFKLPVTIRLRNTCNAALNPTNTTAGTSPSQFLPPAAAGGLNCAQQGTALNQRTIPSARVNLGPSLGQRDIALGGALSAVVEFSDTYDGGALGNVNLKILPDASKGLTTSSVPLLWNNDITGSAVPGGTRSDANFARAQFVEGGPVWLRVADGYDGIPGDGYTAGGAAAATGLKAAFADPANQGCGDWTGTAAGIPNQTAGTSFSPGLFAAGYKNLFYGAPANLGLGVGNGVPGYSVFNASGTATNGGILPVYPGNDNPANIRAGGVIGDNEWVGPNTNPFPLGGSTPGTGTGTTGGTVGSYGNAADTVLRTNALSLDIAPGGVAVNMSTGTTAAPHTPLTTAQGSQDVTLGSSGGQANLFGNIPGKNVGIDVTVNLATKINSIVRIMDQDVFKTNSLLEGEDYPAGIFNCRQMVTGAVQNYIPGVRLTGSLRIAPAITKDGKVRIAKATVRSDANNPDRVALSACLFPAKPYQNYTTTGFGTSDDSAAAKLPAETDIAGGGAVVTLGASTSYALNGNTALPLLDTRRWVAGTANGTGPSTTPCGTDAASVGNGPGLADIIRRSGLTGTVAGLPTPSSDPFQAAGVNYKGDQASVAGDISVNPIEVDVLLGDVPLGT